MIPLQFGGFEEEVLVRTSREISYAALNETGFFLDVGPAGLALIGACDTGDFRYGGLQKIPATEGMYKVWTADHEPAAGDIVRILRIVKVVR